MRKKIRNSQLGHLIEQSQQLMNQAMGRAAMAESRVSQQRENMMEAYEILHALVRDKTPTKVKDVDRAFLILNPNHKDLPHESR